MLGSTVGNYVVEALIGEGGMGAVYVARHPRLGRRVAIKVLHADRRRNAKTVTRFVNEARAASEIGSEHIVDVLDFGELPDGTPYFIMEWLEGQGLDRLLEEEKALPVERAVHILRGIAQALAAAHARGIVHRHLKPENIFLVKRGDDPDFVKVLDFGIAKLLQEGETRGPHTGTGEVFGTPLYMSPEQCRTSKLVDHRSDIYSLGLILYRMLTGTAAFAQDGVGDLLIAHILERPVAPREVNPAIPVSVERTILKAIEKEPANRYSSMGELVSALDDIARPAQKSEALPLPMSSAPLPRLATSAKLRGGAPSAQAPADPTIDPLGRTTPPRLAPAPAAAAKVRTTMSSLASESVHIVPPRRRRLVLVLAAPLVVAFVVVVLLLQGRLAWREPAPPEPTATAGRATADATAAPAAPEPASAATPAPAFVDNAAAAPEPPSAPTAKLKITVDPAEAEVLLDGAQLGNPFEGNFTRNNVRRHLVIKAHGYRDHSAWIVLSSDERELDIALQPEPAKASRAKAKTAPPAAPSASPAPKPQIDPVYVP